MAKDLIQGQVVDTGALPTYAVGDRPVVSLDENGKVLTASSGGAGGTQYTEDAAAAANPVGTVPILVRKDTPSATVSADGDNVAQRGTDYGAAYVTLLDTAGAPVSVGGGTQYTEDAAAAANPIGNMLIGRRKDTLSASEVSADGDNIALNASSKGQLHVIQETLPARDAATDDITIYGQLDDVAPTLPSENGLAAVRITANRALQVNLQTAAGVETGVAAAPLQVSLANHGANATAVKVDGSEVTQPVSGTVTATIAAGATTIAKAEDVASANADVGVPAMAIQKATPADTAGTDGDYAMLQMSGGRLWADAKSSGPAAHDAAVSGNPILNGIECRTTLGTPVSNGDVVRQSGDRFGRSYMVKQKLSQASSNATPISTATDTTVVAAPSAGNHLVIHRIHASNGGATATWVYWRDGASGTRRYPANLPQYGIESLDLNGSWELTSATALVITTTAAGSVEWEVDYETVTD